MKEYMRYTYSQFSCLVLVSGGRIILNEVHETCFQRSYFVRRCTGNTRPIRAVLSGLYGPFWEAD